MRDVVTTRGNALPKDDPPDVTRFRSAASQAGAGAPRADPHGGAMPDGSGQQPHGAPSAKGGNSLLLLSL